MAKYFVSKNTRKEKDIHPDFILSQVPEEQGGKWIEVGALWKSKSGKGYNLKFGSNVTIKVEAKEFTKPDGLKDKEDVEFEKAVEKGVIPF
jgi:hypothetical protein